jgi:uncharacterized membrane protein
LFSQIPQVDFSQFFPSLSDSKFYRSIFSKALQIIFAMQSQRASQKKSSKRNAFF